MGARVPLQTLKERQVATARVGVGLAAPGDVGESGVTAHEDTARDRRGRGRGDVDPGAAAQHPADRVGKSLDRQRVVGGAAQPVGVRARFRERGRCRGGGLLGGLAGGPLGERPAVRAHRLGHQREGAHPEGLQVEFGDARQCGVGALDAVPGGARGDEAVQGPHGVHGVVRQDGPVTGRGGLRTRLQRLPFGPGAQPLAAHGQAGAAGGACLGGTAPGSEQDGLRGEMDAGRVREHGRRAGVDRGRSRGSGPDGRTAEDIGVADAGDGRGGQSGRRGAGRQACLEFRACGFQGRDGRRDARGGGHGRLLQRKIRVAIRPKTSANTASPAQSTAMSPRSPRPP